MFPANENVPKTVFLDPKTWIPFLKVRNQSDVLEVYKAFHSLGEPSRKDIDNPFTYEQPQLQGTCVSQGLMAFIREQIMRRHGTSALEQYGIYKAFKPRLIEVIVESVGPSINKEIDTMAEKKLNKYKTDIALLEKASDQEAYEQELGNLLNAWNFLVPQDSGKKITIQQLIPQKKPPTTSMERYATLRLIHQAIGHFLSYPWNVERCQDPIFQEDLHRAAGSASLDFSNAIASDRISRRGTS